MTPFIWKTYGLFLVPVAVVQIVRARKDRDVMALALELPLTVATDLLTILLLARFMTLESAVRLSRPMWIAGGVACWLRLRGKRAEPPVGGAVAPSHQLGRRAAFAVCLSAAVAVRLSESISRECHISDRAWHIPLSSALRGQRLPFENVYEPGLPLGYHFVGDVFSAMFQVLSGDRIHASLALSIGHDVAFGLLAASIALLLVAWGARRIPSIVAGAVLPLLAGPLTLPTLGQGDQGYSFINYFRLSFRPHVPWAGLFIVGCLGAVASGLSDRTLERPRIETVLALLVNAAALAVADEASLVLLILALFVAWAVVPEVLHPRRWPGLAILAGLGAAIWVVPRAFGNSAGQETAHRLIRWVSWRAPGYGHPALDLIKEPIARWLLLRDLLPLLLTPMPGLVALWVRPRCRATYGLTILYVSLLAASVSLLTLVDVGGVAKESHRFVSCALFLFPIVGGMVWLKLPSGTVVAKISVLMVVTAMFASSISTLVAFPRWKDSYCTGPGSYGSPVDFFAIDCDDYVAERARRTEPTYIERHLLYLYAGCQPVFLPGPPETYWSVRIGQATVGREAFEQVQAMLGAGQSLTLVCPAGDGAAGDDVACRYATEHQLCAAGAPRSRRCLANPDERASILREWRNEGSAASRRLRTGQHHPQDQLPRAEHADDQDRDRHDGERVEGSVPPHDEAHPRRDQQDVTQSR